MGIVDILLAVLYPPACVSCGRAQRATGPARLCGFCRGRLGSVISPCVHCGEPGGALRCAQCRRHPPVFRHLYACCVYREGGALADLILRWKYGGDLVVGDALAGFFAQRLGPLSGPYDLVVPVPLHRTKLRHRGFNQASVLAQGLIHRPDSTGRFGPRVLRRRRANTSQAQTAGALRSHNVAHAFSCGATLRGHRVLLVDDVLTSGATATACARVLLAAGADLVDVAVLGRTASLVQTSTPARLSLAKGPGIE